MQATETSTGVRHDVQAIAKLLKEQKSEALLIVDAITGLGTTHLDMDAWGVDVLVGGSQKAVMIPPGLSYLAVSQRAWDRMESTYNPRYYFDLRKERKNAKNGESAYTPAVALIAALGAALDWIAAQADGDLVEGRKNLVDNAETHRRHDPRRAHALGLQALHAQPRRRSHRSLRARRRRLRRRRQGAEVALRRHHHQRPGRDEGPDLPHRPPGLLRLPGYHSLIGALEQVVVKSLPQLGAKFGDGLIAAQKVFAERTAK